MRTTSTYNRVTLTMLGLTVGLFADYGKAIDYYEKEEYKKAYPLILQEARKGDNKAAQYRIAEMYEKGLGTKVDFQKSIYWYKQAASKYAVVDKKKPVKESSVVSDLEEQVGDKSTVVGTEYALSKFDTDTPETKSFFTSYLNGDFFGLEPYQTNFFLPISYSKDKPRRISSGIHPDAIPGEYQTYNENVEVEFQFSLKKRLSYDLFGLNEYLYLAYTQEVWWQLYDESGPFRETNYRPEIFMSFPSPESWDEAMGLKAMKLGFIHESNGQEGYRSRSWNRLYAGGMWQWDNLLLAARVWYRLKEDRKSDEYYNGELTIEEVIAESDGDDNPDITDYLGYGDINMDYLYGKHKFGLLLRYNFDFDDSKGAVEFSYSYPLFNSPNTFWYAKIFNGYGNSLIDYNVNVTKASFGFSFSTSLY